MHGTKPTPALRNIWYRQPPGRSDLAEIVTLEQMRRRGGLSEFVGPQQVGFDLLLQVTAGTACHEVDSRSYRLSQGDVLWVHSGQVQCWGRVSDLEGRLVLFLPTLLDPDSARIIERSSASVRNHWPGQALPGSPIDLALASAESFRTVAPAGQSRLRDHLVWHAVCVVLLHLAAAKGADWTSTEPDAGLFEAFRMEVDARHRHTRALADYATVLGVSERTLNRAVTGRTGGSASQFVAARVVLEARRLLAYQSLPIADVAAQLGFADASNFSKYFSRRTGLTPGEYRAQARGE